MSGHCGVLHAIEQADVALGLAGLGIDDILRKELAAARADVAELIAADEEYDAAFGFATGSAVATWDARQAARHRRFAALGACKVVQP